VPARPDFVEPMARASLPTSVKMMLPPKSPVLNVLMISLEAMEAMAVWLMTQHIYTMDQWLCYQPNPGKDGPFSSVAFSFFFL